jgi:hypothetical protein
MSDAYVRLISAARSLAGSDIFADGDEIAETTADEFLAKNYAALGAARAAVTSRCAAAVEFTVEYYDRYLPQCWDLFKLCQSFCLAAKVAARQQNLESAANEGIAALDVANAIRRGGLITGMLLGNTAESLAIDPLRRIHRRLDAVAARNLAAEMLRIDAQREPYEMILARDARWSGITNTTEQDLDCLNMEWPEDIRANIDPEDERTIREMMQTISQMPKYESNGLQRRSDDRGLALLRLLTIESALAAFFRDRGVYANSLAELAPSQISHIPLDPYVNGPFCYAANDGECVVYSPGPSGNDHGGQFGCWLDIDAGERDLCLAMGDFSCGG